MRAWKQTTKRIIVLLAILLALPVMAHAAQSASTDYQVNEVFFGAGGELNACSTNYCSKQAAGETAVGNTQSPGYQSQAGFNTDRSAYIQFTVSNTNIDLGTLSPDATATATASFSVKAYLAHGYSVVNASPPPTNESHQLTPIGPAPAISQVGTEQFGINLAANTTPTTFGVNPVQVPDSSFGYGFASINYDTPNNYMYAEGASQGTVAESLSSTSETDYTISYIFNISHVTPGGTYSFHHVLVATATY
jgi:hypothetical protein